MLCGDSDSGFFGLAVQVTSRFYAKSLNGKSSYGVDLLDAISQWSMVIPGKCLSLAIVYL